MYSRCTIHAPRQLRCARNKHTVLARSPSAPPARPLAPHFSSVSCLGCPTPSIPTCAHVASFVARTPLFVASIFMNSKRHATLAEATVANISLKGLSSHAMLLVF
ncbi:hypothetical protein TRVL_06092 [Trypanosoma vivax]|nr:hypothetical protein TRVL_06092 [Trypanosoma vivax]